MGAAVNQENDITFDVTLLRGPYRLVIGKGPEISAPFFI